MSKSPRSLRYATTEAMPAGMRKLVQAQQQPGYRGYNPPAAPAKRNKYGATPTMVDGIRFDSKREANFYQRLTAEQAAGRVKYFLRQQPLHLPGGTKLVVDFVVHMADDDEKAVLPRRDLERLAELLDADGDEHGVAHALRALLAAAEPAPGPVRYVDAKGRETDAFKIKRREVEHRYPFTIELV